MCGLVLMGCVRLFPMGFDGVYMVLVLHMVLHIVLHVVLHMVLHMVLQTQHIPLALLQSVTAI